MSLIATKIDEQNQEGPIRCIFFSEFHPTAGPKIICQVNNFYNKFVYNKNFLKYLLDFFA